MPYTPNPIDTADVALPEDLKGLAELLSEHVHDVWALQRMAQSWTYGPKRNDDLKLHPCLVPYAELSESDKDLDRESALGTLRAILALGYRIEPPGKE
jgi:ryanodine receptor 2